MQDARWERLAAGTGFVAVVLFIVSFTLPGVSLATVRSYDTSNKTSLLAAFLLLWMGSALFLWFLGALRSYLRRYEGGSARLSRAAFASGLVALAVVLIMTVIPVETGATVHLARLALVLAGVPSAVAVTAASVVVLRRGALPVWTAWLGLLAVVITGISAVSGGAAPVGAAAFASTMLWVLVVATTMLHRMRSTVVSTA